MGRTSRADPAAGRRVRSRKGEGRRLRGEILDATERLLLLTGSSEAVAIRDVAASVGVTPPSIYRHFPDKATLIFEVSGRHFATLDDAFEEAEAGIDDPVEALVALGRAYVDFGRRNPEPYRILFLSRYDTAPEQFQDGRLGEVVALGRAVRRAEAGIAAGRFRPEHCDAGRLAVGFWAQLHGLTSLLVTKPTFPWPPGDFVDAYVVACLQGVLHDPQHDPELRGATNR